MPPANRPVGVALLGCMAAAASISAQQTPAQLVQFLRRSIGLDSTQLAVVERGTAVVKVLDTKNKRDVAVFGVITVDVPRELYVGRLKDFPSSLRTPTRTRFGIFGDPPAAVDVQALVVNNRDVSERSEEHTSELQSRPH